MATRRRRTGVMVYARELNSRTWHILVDASRTSNKQVGLCMQIFRVATVHHGRPKNVCPGCFEARERRQETILPDLVISGNL